jgi:long-chain-fatty-acid--CoA ligase ACSBG
MDSEGFFHTGDIGHLDPKTGHLDITGRLKELIITAGGENVSPIPIEEALKEICPIISQALVIGDERKYLTCLLTIKCKSGEN